MVAEGNVTLSTGMRTSLLTVQNASQKQTRAQERLTTGLKINAALDNPPAFFAARDLDRRADDLMALKDAMAQAISTVKAADKGVQAIGALTEHAKGLTVAALQNLGDDEASRLGRQALAKQYDDLLTQIDKVVADSGYGGKNLINSKASEYLPTPTSKAKAVSAPGIKAIDVTNAKASATYTVRTYGDGAIAASEQGAKDIKDALGLNHFRLFGYNSLTNGTFAPTKVELRRNGSGKATLTVFEGEEHTSIDIDLALASRTGPLRDSYKHLFQNGTWVAFDYDAVALAKLAKDQPLTDVEVEKSINLHMDLSDNLGHTKSLSLADGGPARIRDGWNDVTIGGATVRINIDQKTLQASSNYQSSSMIDGPLAASMRDIAFDNLGYDGAANFSYEENFDSNSGQIIGNFFTTPLYGNYPTSPFATYVIDSTNINPSETITFGTLGVANHTAITATFGMSSVVGKVTSGIRASVIGLPSNSYLYAGGGGSPVPLGWKGWNASTVLNVTVGTTDSGGTGFQKITVTDTTGSQGTATIPNNYTFADEQAGVPITMKGGANEGAVLRLLGSAPEQAQIRVQVGGDGIFPTAGIATVPYLSASDYDHISGVSALTYLTVTDNGNDSAGAGQRRIDVAVAPNIIAAPTVHSFNISNDALDHVDFSIPSGFAQGTRFQMSFDPASGGLSQAPFVLFPPTTSGGLTEPTTYVYRAANRGEAPQVDVRQHIRYTEGDDLIVQVGQLPTDTVVVSSKNLTTSGTGLALDRSTNGWNGRDDIEKAMSELNAASQKLRSVSIELGTSMGIITTRDTFTKEFSDVLNEGASKLTLADQNEEGAIMLALQMRQQLGMTGLSLASQSQRSILNLFG